MSAKIVFRKTIFVTLQIKSLYDKRLSGLDIIYVFNTIRIDRV